MTTSFLGHARAHSIRFRDIGCVNLAMTTGEVWSQWEIYERIVQGRAGTTGREKAIKAHSDHQ